MTCLGQIGTLGDVAGTSYGGVGVDTRYNEISKARHPWLKYKSK